MRNPYDYRVILTEEQKQLLEQVVSALEKHVNKEPCGYVYYVTIEGDDMCSDYQTCDNEKCLSSVKKIVEKEYINKDIEFLCQDNNNDYGNLEKCSVCGHPLNEFLTWIRDEFEYHSENTILREDIIGDAFDLKAIIQSYPSNDNTISQFAINESLIGNDNLLKEQIKRRDDFTNKVLEYCKLIKKEIIS